VSHDVAWAAARTGRAVIRIVRRGTFVHPALSRFYAALVFSPPWIALRLRRSNRGVAGGVLRHGDRTGHDAAACHTIYATRSRHLPLRLPALPGAVHPRQASAAVVRRRSDGVEHMRGVLSVDAARRLWLCAWLDALPAAAAGGDS